jgi:hypothetical protein
MNKSALRWRTSILTIVSVALLVGLIPDAAATRYKRETLADLVRQSAVIMIGTVVGIEYREDKKTEELFTDIKVRPIRAVAGGDQLKMGERDTIKLAFSGGLNSKGQMEVLVGLPELALGQTYILFLRGGEWSLNPIAGWTQGALRLVAIEKGGDHVMFDVEEQVVTGLKDGYLAYSPLPPSDGRGALQRDCDQKPSRIEMGTQANLEETQKQLSDSIYREDNSEELQRQDAERQEALSEKRPKHDRLARMRKLLGEEPMKLSDLVSQVNEIRSAVQKDIDPKMWEYHPEPIPGITRSAPALEPNTSRSTQEGQQ